MNYFWLAYSTLRPAYFKPVAELFLSLKTGFKQLPASIMFNQGFKCFIDQLYASRLAFELTLTPSHWLFKCCWRWTSFSKLNFWVARLWNNFPNSVSTCGLELQHAKCSQSYMWTEDAMSTALHTVSTNLENNNICPLCRICGIKGFELGLD